MMFPFRHSTNALVCALAFALILSAADAVHAKDAASAQVETYVDQALPVQEDTGVLPDGMSFNRPMKAGELVLPRDTDLKKRAKPVSAAPQLPVGEPKAPLLPQTSDKATPPQFNSESNSTASVMLLQGMKNALQQAGQNPDIPKSSVVAPEPTDGKAIESVQVQADLKAPILITPPGGAGSGESAPVVTSAAASGVKYQPGQEPKSFGAAAQTATAKDGNTEIGSNEIILPSSSGAKTESLTSLLDSSPLSSAPAAEEPEPAAAASAAAASAAATTSSPDVSIFGAPVADEANGGEDSLGVPSETAVTPPPAPVSFEASQQQTSSAKATTKKSKKGGKCVPDVTKWTRACTEAGYPASFSGQIVGETRTECPNGETHDVWLSNSCAQGEGQPEAAAPSGEGNVIVPQTPATQDGACGVANGLAAAEKPASDLCNQGQPSAVLGEGPWRWNCQGLGGGMTVSCAAPVAPEGVKAAAKAAGPAAQEIVAEDGKCGPANGAGTDAAPTADLCAKGVASNVNGSGPWTWACSGTNGGQAAACTAARKTDGACGAAVSDGTDTMPMRDLCESGYASAVTGTGPWNWTCSGLYGGAPATCAAQPKQNAICGQASMKGHRSAPAANLCSVGTATAVEGAGPWTWSCMGHNGGATVSCQAPTLADGACGPANGNQYEKAPTEGLCASGSASRVTGPGPFRWTCSGIEGGNTVSCTASLGSKESLASVVSCGPASEALALSEPTENLCAAGKPSAVSGSGPWTWTCADDAGHSASCSTPSASDGACGKASGVASAVAPKTGLCSSGIPGDVTSDSGTSEWKWDCNGSMGGGSTSCAAPVAKGGPMALTAAPSSLPSAPHTTAGAECGSAAGKSFANPPENDLCAAGKASAVRGSGPWSWMCTAPGKKGAHVVCEAQRTLDGVCGAANGSIQRAAPQAGLCAAGTPTEVTGNGPWLWSCVGSGNGGSVSCSAASQAQTKVDGTCGAAANAVMTSAPQANLCDSGTPSAVYGNGPWTWTCSGMNGGIASTCGTSKVLPKAPPPPGPAVNGLCGPANGVVALEAPTEDVLCSTGTASAISGNGPWNWSCIGGNGGMTVSCTAPLMPPAPIVGACGAASGVPTLTAPKSALCAAGIVSAVSGSVPWTWSCSGTNGGGAVSCVAPLAGHAGNGAPLPSLATPSLEGEAPAPKASPAGLVTPTLPTGPLPPTKADVIPNRKTSAKGSLAKEASALPAVSLTPMESAPASTPTLPDGTEPLMPPPVRDTLKPTPGLKPPVLDSEGNPVPGARLILDTDVSTVSFVRGSDQMDKDAVTAVEKLANILLANGNARITLVAYSDTGGSISPRDARKISLNRALAIRDFLASKGVPSSRVDVRPMGANVPSGDMDRVDVKVN